jgi:two-component system response regulator HydG
VLTGTPRVLVVDPSDEDARRTVEVAASLAGSIVRVTDCLVEAVRCARDETTDCIVSELSLRDATGERVVRSIRHANPGVPLVVVTRHGSEMLAARSIQLGAFDYVTKVGEDWPRLASAIESALGQALLRQVARVSPVVSNELTSEEAATTDERAGRSMALVVALAQRAAESGVPVLLEGETGTGKEVLARRIHTQSARRRGVFLVQNCAALTDSLLDTELFGHLRGAFTGADRDRRGLFAEASDGTVLLDEIGEAPSGLQAKLLRVLQNAEVKAVGSDRSVPVTARIIAATNRRLEDEVAAGRFRSDLYYRLAVFPIHVPPLRDRPEDILPLVHRFLRRFEADERRTTGGFAPDTLDLLIRYPWPGNVRELEHEVHRLVLTASAGHRLHPQHLAPRIRAAVAPPPEEPLLHILKRVETAVIRERLHHLPTKAAAARSLGITREALYWKMRRLGVVSRRVVGE